MFSGVFSDAPKYTPSFRFTQLHGNRRDWTIRKGQTGWRSAGKPRGYWIWFMALDDIRQKITARKRLIFTVWQGQTRTGLLIKCLLNILFSSYSNIPPNIPPICTSQNFRQGFCCSHDTRADAGFSRGKYKGSRFGCQNPCSVLVMRGMKRG